MPAHSDDDLFRPTLTEADDAVDFDHPWNPWSLVVLAFFFTLVTGGGLLALNFRRLGMKGRLYPTLAVVIVATVLMGVARVAVSRRDVAPNRERESKRTVQLAMQAASCLIAMAIAVPQHKRFRLYQASGRTPGRLLWPALAAIGVNFVVWLIVMAIVSALAVLRIIFSPP